MLPIVAMMIVVAAAVTWLTFKLWSRCEVVVINRSSQTVTDLFVSVTAYDSMNEHHEARATSLEPGGEVRCKAVLNPKFLVTYDFGGRRVRYEELGDLWAGEKWYVTIKPDGSPKGDYQKP